VQTTPDFGLCILAARHVIVGLGERHQELRGDERVRDLKRLAPFAVLLREPTLLIAAFAAPVSPPRIEDASMRASHHGLGLNVIHDIAHRLARPHTICANRRAREYLANGQVSGNKAQLGFLNCTTNGFNNNGGVAFESFRFVPITATSWSLRCFSSETTALIMRRCGNDY
jgi:hypothetical protein